MNIIKYMQILKKFKANRMSISVKYQCLKLSLHVTSIIEIILSKYLIKYYNKQMEN